GHTTIPSLRPSETSLDPGVLHRLLGLGFVESVDGGKGGTGRIACLRHFVSGVVVTGSNRIIPRHMTKAFGVSRDLRQAHDVDVKRLGCVIDRFSNSLNHIVVVSRHRWLPPCVLVVIENRCERRQGLDELSYLLIL